MLQELEPFRAFLATVASAPNETARREAFVALAATGFADSDLVATLALGAEYSVRFEQAGLIRRGSIDSFFGNLIVEFEHDLGRMLPHALDQLRGYVAGAWTADGHVDRPYLAVATDGRRWEVFSPHLIDPGAGLSAENVELRPVDAWIGTGADDDASSLRDFLNRLLFRQTLVAPTAENFARDFGLRGPAYLAASDRLLAKLRELGDDSELDVLVSSWRRSLQVAYGSVDAESDLFVKHTYLAVFARLLVWSSLERRPLRDAEVEAVIDGSYFRSRGISNLVEDDFFRWWTLPSQTSVRDVWKGLAAHLAGYDLEHIGEDVLKALYEQLVDPESRHDLGEYYTPDWLATRVVDRVLGQWSAWDDGRLPAVLDPTCGSGTFLRCAIAFIRERSGSVADDELLDRLTSSVVGIDVHPLAVTIAKATYAVAISDLLAVSRVDIALPVYLADSLRMPAVNEAVTLLGETVAIEIDDQSFDLPLQLIQDGSDFDAALGDVVTVAKSYGDAPTDLGDVKSSVAARVGDRLRTYAGSGAIVETLGEMASCIAQLIRERRNSIHGFLLRNHYRPTMLALSFDFIVGNPPWLTISSIGDPTYKASVVELATRSGVASRRPGELAHTELATVFLAQIVEKFLRPTSAVGPLRIGLVMPRSVFSATQHRFLREGTYVGAFRVDEIWDLEGVTPLFRVPSCVIFASVAKPLVQRAIAGWEFSGHLATKDPSAEESETAIDRLEATFDCVFLGRRSAWRARGRTEGLAQAGVSGAYVEDFEQGAVIYPQRLFTVAVVGDAPATRMRTVQVRTDERNADDARLLREVSVDHALEGRCLFSTYAARHLLPYRVIEDPVIVALPVLVDPSSEEFRAVSPAELRRAGRVEAAGWLEWAQAQWETVRPAGDTSDLWERIDYMRHLRSQAARLRYVVLYTASGSRTVAGVLDSDADVYPFVARDKTYWMSTDSRAEADFVCAMLNSDYAAEQINEWMTRGLFGARDVHKRILDVPWPRFDPLIPEHSRLAEVSGQLAGVAAALDLPTGSAGRLRTMLRAALPQDLLDEVESLVATISTNQADLSARLIPR